MKLNGLKITNKRWWLFIAAFLIYPALVLSYVWLHCYKSVFEGGKLGQLDAYRHTLASAVVSYTFSPLAVDLVTLIESKNNSNGLMDIHNNRIGATIGRQATRFSALENQVFISVNSGAENATDSDQITWLPKAQWEKSLFW